MKNKIKNIFSKEGINEVGFCPFFRVKEHLIPCRGLSRIPNGAKTVILCLFPYKVKSKTPKNISRYAAVPDYHKICGEYLERLKLQLESEFNDNKFEWFIDNSPIPEVASAAAAGLGVVGKNGLLINRTYGSFVFIGEIVTDLDIFCDDFTALCPDCGKCKAACPVGLNKNLCLSALSQKKGVLFEEELSALRQNNIVWGCDICQNVCPLNKDAQTSFIPEFLNGYRHTFHPQEDITDRAYEWRGPDTVMRNFKNLQENK